MNAPIHQLSPAQFEAFCAGAVHPEVMSLLRAGQNSRRRLLLSALMDGAAHEPGAVGPLAEMERAWRLLVAVEERAPDVVEDVLMWPSAGVWLIRAVRRLHGVALDDSPLWVELGFLHSLAAAAAVRVRLPCEIDVPVVHGAVTLPTVGQFRFRATTGTGVARLRVTLTGVALLPLPAGDVSPPTLDASKLVPVRRHLGVEIDDCTPYRWFSTWEPPDPLHPEESTAWTDDLDDAWRILTRWHTRFASELSAGLTTLAPIAPSSRVIGASASAAFGGVVLSRADSPASLAATLIHELQHSKLNALLDLVVLHTSDATELTYAPWRDDPRPLTGLLHGIYAFTAVVEFWHAQRRHEPASARRKADFTFVHRHMQVVAAIESLESVRGLTALGRRLVESARLRLARCPLDDVPAELVETAETIIMGHRKRRG